MTDIEFLPDAELHDRVLAIGKISDGDDEQVLLELVGRWHLLRASASGRHAAEREAVIVAAKECGTLVTLADVHENIDDAMMIAAQQLRDAVRALERAEREAT